MLPSETMIWQPEFTDKTLSRKPGAVQNNGSRVYGSCPEKNPRCACKSVHRYHHGSPAAYR
ncbi:hypothetical protein BK333_24365 [Escherichia coli]|nr:hypothetical protein BK333_24365 [Escherichia coli]